MKAYSALAGIVVAAIAWYGRTVGLSFVTQVADATFVLICVDAICTAIKEKKE